MAPHRFWLLAAVGAACAIKLTLALATLGTNDVLTWRWFAQLEHTFGGTEVYRRTAADIELFNHPPFMLHVLRIQTLLVGATAVPFPFWLRLPAIAADVASVGLVWLLLRRDKPRQLALKDALFVAVAPVSIMVSGFHGNTDPVVMCFVLAAIYALSTERQAWLAGVALGAALNVKVVALIFVPALLCYRQSMRDRVAMFGAAGVTVAAGSLPYLAQDLPLVARNVLGYGSLYGQWGVSRLMEFLAVVHPLPNLVYSAVGRFVALGASAAVAVWSSRLRPVPSLYERCALSAFAFMTFTPGFGVQYLAWLVPWAPAAGTGAAGLFYAISGLFLFGVYSYWAGGLPWYFANSWEVGPWTRELVYLELACWGTVVVCFRRIALQMRAWVSPSSL